MNHFRFNQMKGNSQNVINLGFFHIQINFDGSAQVLDAVNKSRLVNAQSHGAFKKMTLQEAFDFCKKNATHMWENNDKQYLINEYGLSKEFVNEYLRYTATSYIFPEQD